MSEERVGMRRVALTGVVLCAVLALLSSTLLAVGAHEHLSGVALDAVCSADHGSDLQPPGPGEARTVHGVGQPHRHHCASCQLAAKSAAKKAESTAILSRPSTSSSSAATAVTIERWRPSSTAAPRGPPLS